MKKAMFITGLIILLASLAGFIFIPVIFGSALGIWICGVLLGIILIVISFMGLSKEETRRRKHL